MIEKIDIRLLTSMIRIRMVEEEIALRYPEGKMRCPVHLSIGQEAVPAAVSEAIEREDFAVSTHRGHAHYLGKGGDLKAMIAEIYGKVTGCSKGKGGSMHLIDRAAGFMGTSAIVGNSIPLGVGLGLSARLKKTRQISCVFLGDGATEEGAYYESVNFAVLKKLPVLFLVENNFYSVYSPLSVRQPENRKISDVAEALGLQVKVVDGNNVQDCFSAISTAVASIRNGDGPVLIEFSTYRWREHCGPAFDNHIGYRTQDEFEMWKENDPVLNLENQLLAIDSGFEKQLKEIKVTIGNEIADAFKFAESSAFPNAIDAYTGEYAQ
uniref:thiamine pyrophosphate-dependent dehydrogenase E1 component subunit alpha n=1 Tax=Algoriphagus sp. TaxID=1872435 RepID=UPI004048CDBD